MVIADDTDISILLLHHQAKMSCNLYMQTKQHIVSINHGKEVLGRDTTSALFSIGKIKLLKALQESQKTRSDVHICGENEVLKYELGLVGEQFVKILYSGGTDAKGLKGM